MVDDQINSVISALSTANICKITIILSDFEIWHILSMFSNFRVTEITIGQENWILVTFSCNVKIKCKPQNFACNHYKTLTFNISGVPNGLNLQKLFHFTKSVNRKNCGWQFPKPSVFFIVNRKNLTKTYFFLNSTKIRGNAATTKIWEVASNLWTK